MSRNPRLVSLSITKRYSAISAMATSRLMR